jgi:multidrug efflux pump subunit AcrA (membrane-fusion protein)
MIRKALLLVVPVALVATIAAVALSQSPDAKNSGSAVRGKASAAARNEAFPSGRPQAPVTSPRPVITPTSFSPPTSSSAERRQVYVDRALVTLIHDTPVPATEAGMLTRVPVEEGQDVEEQDQVAEIDTRSTLAKQRVALGPWQAAKAQAENDAEIEVAIKAEEVAKASLESIDDILRKNPKAVSEMERRKYYFELEKAKAQIKQAVNEKNVAGLTANAKEAEYEAASIELNLRQIRSPFKGQVVEVMKRVGDWVTPGEPIMHIVGLDQVRVKGFVLITGPEGASQEDVDKKPVTITVDSVGGKKHTVKGIIGFANPVIEGVGSSRQFKVWADIENERVVDPATGRQTWKIQPGSVATMTIDLTAAPAARPLASVSAERPAERPAEKTSGKRESYKPVSTSRER